MVAKDDSFYHEYFSSLLNLMRDAGVHVTPTPYRGQFQIVYSWPDRVHIAVNVLRSTYEIRVDLTLKSGKADEQYQLLEKDKREIAAIVGSENLEWNPTPKTERQIVLRWNGIDPTEKSDWPRQHAWLASRLVTFRLAFGPRIEAWQR